MPYPIANDATTANFELFNTCYLFSERDRYFDCWRASELDILFSSLYEHLNDNGYGDLTNQDVQEELDESLKATNS